MAEHVVGPVADFPPGTHRVVRLGRAEVGVFNVGGRFYALPNVCPHQYGPLCKGSVTGTTACSAQTGWRFAWVREGEVVACPWHGLEFDITTGRCLASPRLRVRQYPVGVIDGQVTVTL
ncbi:MAG: Rieske (2Fe-2S) region [uncultured Thermomicrobiales bacterium]|uniref:Rieske (2Fe-2S) region n=1 Tax=uncultured Thermomicrobiales bacterium TaxID=1645740 RepID=A0A6J4UKV9_9BACT|nr:MAG: Rieske (2Fe-2S) region [uncultured Thermomicrobiales bacterium]